MNIIVFGATGKTGLQITEQALVQGHRVTAAVRTPSKMTLTHQQLTVVACDVLDKTAVVNAVAGHDAVVCSIGGAGLNDTVRSDGTAHIIAGMQKHAVSRIVIISSMGAGESGKQLSLPGKLFVKLLLKNVIADHERQEGLLAASELTWTSVRPSGLTDGPATEAYQFGNDSSLKGTRVSRADVAHFVLRVLAEDLFLNQGVSIS